MDTDENDKEKIRKTKELTILLLDKSHTENYRDKDSLPDVVKWFESLTESLKDGLPSDAQTVFHINLLLVPQLLQLLRECVLTHRWGDALKVLGGLVREPGGTATTVWKVGMELMYSSPSTNSNLIGLLVNQLQSLKSLNAKEVVLEYIFYLLNMAQLVDVKNNFQGVPKNLKRPSDRSRHVDLLFSAYQGLVWYVEWLSIKQKAEYLEALEEDNSFMQFSQLSVNQDALMKSYAEKAITCFSALKGELGIWDIFIKKHVSLLEYNQQIEEARDLLQAYRDKNPENPNAHKYLYHFCVDQGVRTAEQIELIKSFAVNVPSDPLVLELCELLKAEGRYEMMLPYLFSLLDYECWKDEERPWTLLSVCLQGINNSQTRDVLLDWKKRENWWPIYHFSPDLVDIGEKITESQKNVMVIKAVVAIHLLGTDNDYSRRISQNVDIQSSRRITEAVTLCRGTSGVT